MTARLSFRRALAVAGIVTAGAVSLTAGSAFAAGRDHHPTQPSPSPAHNMGHQPGPVHIAGHQPNPHHIMVTTLRTRMHDVQIRTSPILDRHTRSVSTLRRVGSKVAVTCYTMGSREKGSNIWFETVAPARGYISSSAVARPAHPVMRCGK